MARHEVCDRKGGESVNLLAGGGGADPEANSPRILFDNGSHQVWWLGAPTSSAFRCNTYLVVDNGQTAIIDPGGKETFDIILARVREVMDPRAVGVMVLSHQDPDVAGCMHQWLRLNPEILVAASPRTNVLLPFYCHGEYNRHDTEAQPLMGLGTGGGLRFIPAPFLHFPGAVATLDEVSGYLFSGDVWASLDVDSRLIARDFSVLRPQMDLFNKDYMAGRRATRGFVESLLDHDVEAILPQHGALIPQALVPAAFSYLETLECGLDIIYPEADSFFDDLPESIPGYPSDGLAIEEEAWPVEPGPAFGSEAVEDSRRLTELIMQVERISRIKDQAIERLKKARRGLAFKEAMLSEAQAVAHVGTWQWNISSGRLYWTEEIFRIFGMEPGSFEPSYLAFLNVVHPDDRVEEERAVGRALEDKGPYRIIHRIRRPDGSVRTVQERGRVFRNERGEPIRMLGTVQDITSLARAEEELVRQKWLVDAIQRMQAAFIASDDLHSACKVLHDSLLDITSSPHCFVGEVRRDAEGRPYLYIHALSDMSWDAGSRALFLSVRERGMEFHDLDNLFGRVISTGSPVIANDPAFHPARRGVPEGHPRLRAFLGLPVHYGKEVVGEIGLANRPGGYDSGMVSFLIPLVDAFAHVIMAAREQESRKRMERMLEEQAMLDGLLGIANRRRFEQYLEQQVRYSSRHGVPLAIIMIDVDHFKLYNDCYGHIRGDECLRRLAMILRRAMGRPMDMAARYGGEEFCCVLPETGLSGAVQVAERINHLLEQEQIEHKGSPVASRVTVSMGLAVWSPGISSHALVEWADRCLYEAKHAGRNRIVAASMEEE